jgi:hypothetical protein
MMIRKFGAVLLMAASAAVFASEAKPGPKPAPDKMEANADQLAPVPACTGPSCAAPATANHAINEKGTPGTACPKPTAPPPSSGGGGCHNPCTCPPPN